jgi:hypothetical protein
MTDQPKKLNVAIGSTVLANHRRELFAQLLVQGFTAVDAYEKAGYKRHDGNACTLAKHPEVQVRLEEIRGELSADFPLGTSAIAARANVTPESLKNEAEEVRVQAMANGQLSAAINAIKEKGVLSGKRVERSEVGGPGEFDHMSDEELHAEIMREIAELGFILVESSKPQH